MGAPNGPPRPGPLLRFLMGRRLSPSQTEQALTELEELYDHRTTTEGRAAADRWLAREHKRWVIALIRGRLDVNRVVSDSVRGRARGGLGLTQDIRHNLRGLARSPLLAAALVVTVGLGIGGTTLVYAVVHSVLVAPLPYPGSDRMVLLRTIHGEDMWSTSMADLDALYEAPGAFEAIAGYSYGSPGVLVGDGSELIRSKWVTDNYFPLMGIEPLAGRSFTADEGRGGGPRAVMITDAFRERAFAAREDALGRTLVIDGEPHAIVGILPDRMGPLEQVDLYPALQVETPGRKGPFYYQTIGRLNEGVDEQLARQQLDAVADRLFPIWQESFTLEEATIGFVDLKEILVGDVARTLLIVLTGVGFLLLIASANAASLLVARGIGREREVAVRAALGASRHRLFQLLLSEAGILAAAGGLLGLVLAGLGADLVRRLGIDHLPRAAEITLSAPVLAFFVVVTFASWALFGLIAAGAVLRHQAAGPSAPTHRSTTSRGMRRLRRGLVAAQFAVSIPLLVGAGLLGRSLDRLRGEDFGFDPHNLVSMQVALPSAAYSDWEAVRGFWADVLPEVQGIPGVIAAGLSDARPPVQWNGSNNFLLEDRPDVNENLQAPWITADPGYFRALGLETVEGRIFNDPLTDTMRTAVVDQAWSERFFPGQSPLGRRFRSGGCTIDGCPWVEIVGVVSNVKTTGIEDDHRAGTIYYDQNRDSYSTTYLHLRTQADPLALVPAVRRVISGYDATVPVADVRTVTDLAAESLAGRTYTSVLVLLLAGGALLLSVVGIYGAMSYYVRQHARDIGIRLALGEGPGAALAVVVRQGMQVAALGTIIGIGAALGLTRFMSGLLYEVSATDPLVLGVVTLTTLGVALAATAIPGRAAAAMDPAVALRED